jgi:hypothetical protein
MKQEEIDIRELADDKWNYEKSIIKIKNILKENLNHINQDIIYELKIAQKNLSNRGRKIKCRTTFEEYLRCCPLAKSTAYKYIKFDEKDINKEYMDYRKSIGSIYIIQEEILGNIKIGFAKNVKERIKDIQVGNSQKLNLLKIIPNKKTSDEKQLHKKFKKYNIRDEWFDKKILEEIV